MDRAVDRPLPMALSAGSVVLRPLAATSRYSCQLGLQPRPMGACNNSRPKTRHYVEGSRGAGVPHNCAHVRLRNRAGKEQMGYCPCQHVDYGLLGIVCFSFFFPSRP